MKKRMKERKCFHSIHCDSFLSDSFVFQLIFQFFQYNHSLPHAEYNVIYQRIRANEWKRVVHANLIYFKPSVNANKEMYWIETEM